MGYNTEFRGQFKITPSLQPHHLRYLQKFNEVRHVKRDPAMLATMVDPLRKAVELPVGEDGVFFVGGKTSVEMLQGKDMSIIDYNGFPSAVPSSYCQWRPSDHGTSLEWDGGEKFYNYVEWLEFLIHNFLKPWGYVLDGKVCWRGEEFFDIGTILLRNNEIELLGDIAVTDEEGWARKLRVFLCHAKEDRVKVEDLYRRLKGDFVEPWLDKEDLIAGEDWEEEIRKAVKDSDLFIACLSKNSVDKVGFLQKEIRFALDVADLQPEGRIFIIPLKLEECEVPGRLSRWHWVNYFEEDGYHKLKRALSKRADQLSE